MNSQTVRANTTVMREEVVGWGDDFIVAMTKRLPAIDELNAV